MGTKLKKHKAHWDGLTAWPLCWWIAAVFYENRVYKLTNDDSKVECFHCRNHMGKK